MDWNWIAEAAPAALVGGPSGLLGAVVGLWLQRRYRGRK